MASAKVWPLIHIIAFGSKLLICSSYKHFVLSLVTACSRWTRDEMSLFWWLGLVFFNLLI